jgi:hypothetical protein
VSSRPHLAAWLDRVDLATRDRLVAQSGPVARAA